MMNLICVVIIFQLCQFRTTSTNLPPCIETFKNESLPGRFAVTPWDSNWLFNPDPWNKADFIVPFCQYCKCMDNKLDPRMLTRSWKLSELLLIIEKHLNHLVPEKKFILNYGAADSRGGDADPTYELLLDPTNSGLLIDGQTEDVFFSKYPKRDNVMIAKGVNIKLSDAIQFLQLHQAPKRLTVVKIDIDSFECPLLSLLLQNGYYSLIYHIEFNPTVVPPIRFQPTGTDDSEYDNRLWRNQNPFYGCSLSSIADILVPAGYHLIEVDGWDATFAHSSVAHIFEPIPLNPEVADMVGFRNRFDLFPCYREGTKIYHEKVLELSFEVRNAKRKKDSQGMHKALQSLHELFNQFAPKHKESHQAFPYFLGVEGPSDLYYYSHVHEHLHDKYMKGNFSNRVCLI